VAVNSQRERFKRELLRGAVEENVDTLAGVPLGTTRREREARRRRRRLVAMISGASLAVVLVTIGIWSTVASAARDNRAAARGDVVVTTPLPFVHAPSDDSSEPERLAAALAAGEHQAVLAESLPWRCGRSWSTPATAGETAAPPWRSACSRRTSPGTSPIVSPTGCGGAGSTW
jgi:hypothetical protein